MGGVKRDHERSRAITEESQDQAIQVNAPRRQFVVYTIAYIALLNLIRWAVPSAKSAVEFLWAPWGIAMIFWALPWFVLSVAFGFGAIRCPLCGNSFGSRFVWVSRRCSSCHQDVLAPPAAGQAT
jgi:hypothetical protein